ncbi:MAG: hypothetical protein JWP76_2869 [Dactylosporangium sp.]|nr:hypothetical protein [Dactylosporangium sp.]
MVGGVLVTVNELLSLPSGERLDRPEPVPPVVDAETYLTLVTVANALGELVARRTRSSGTRQSRRRARSTSRCGEAVVEIRSAIAGRSHPHRRAPALTHDLRWTKEQRCRRATASSS